MNKKMTLQKLERLLLDACDTMRTEVESSDYKKYIFAMIFLKRLSDQFDVEKDNIRKRNEGKSEKIIQMKLTQPINYKFFVPEAARWSKIKDTKGNVGNVLNKALEALEDKNTETLEGVLKHINFNEKIGNKTLSDSLLVELIGKFDKILLTDDNFEFPDLLGRAYEYLIKFFADDAGKKGGEFYTAGEVVRLLVNIIESKEGDRILDPTVGSGGMLIQSKQYVEESGGNTDNLTLYGQEVKGATWSICKMNMLLHNINSAEIKQGDTLTDPQHKTNGELTRFDKVIANPPFSQNYVKKDLPAFFNTRFCYGYPPEKKKADFMFLQHMIAVLNENGKMACVMPHGVLFRGGEEKNIRQGIIDEGILEAVIGLPANLFYGTGIPACIIVINKKDKEKRDSILFINADKEFKEGTQNKLRPEDIQKIVNVYRKKEQIGKYSKLVKISDLDDYNLNIRRYVDNSNDTPNQDVTAHLNGGIPNCEIDAFVENCKAHALDVYSLFNKENDRYSHFIADNKETLKTDIIANINLVSIDNDFYNRLKAFWRVAENSLSLLPTKKKLYDRKQNLMSEFKKVFDGQTMLEQHKVEGIFAEFWSESYADLRSVENSGWNAEIISDEYLVMSQFPEVISQKEHNLERISTLEAEYDEKLKAENGDDEEIDKIKQLKEDKKAYSTEKSEANKHFRAVTKSLKEAAKAGEEGEYRNKLENVVNLAEKDLLYKTEKLRIVEDELKEFTALEMEIKYLKDELRAIDKKMGDLADKARDQISDEEAKKIILQQFFNLFETMLKNHIDEHFLSMQRDIENLWDKYSTSLSAILQKREEHTKVLNDFLAELGYVI